MDWFGGMEHSSFQSLWQRLCREASIKRMFISVSMVFRWGLAASPSSEEVMVVADGGFYFESEMRAQSLVEVGFVAWF